MIKIIFFLFLFPYLLTAQEGFTMKYGCMKSFENGKWTSNKKTSLQVDFSVGSNKDIILTDNQGHRFQRTGEPFVSENKSKMRFQVIPVIYDGSKYLIQYFENYNLRLIRVSDNLMLEYSCVQDFNKDKGTNNNLYSVISDRAYFYNSPNKSTKRNSYIIYGEVIKALKEQSGFVYVFYLNSKGVNTKGWLLKSDISKY
jgi:hypothetical protein